MIYDDSPRIRERVRWREVPPLKAKNSIPATLHSHLSNRGALVLCLMLFPTLISTKLGPVVLALFSVMAACVLWSSSRRYLIQELPSRSTRISHASARSTVHVTQPLSTTPHPLTTLYCRIYRSAPFQCSVWTQRVHNYRLILHTPSDVHDLPRSHIYC